MGRIILINEQKKIIRTMYIIFFLLLIMNFNILDTKANCNKALKPETIRQMSGKLRNGSRGSTEEELAGYQQQLNYYLQHQVTPHQQQHQQQQQFNHQIIKRSINIEKFNTSTVNSSLINNSNQNQTEQVSYNDLDVLRLEYYKYRILTQLGMDSNPDDLSPDLNSDLKKQLISSTALLQKADQKRAVNLRQKRSLACNQVKSNKDACCLETFYVNFTDIGWDKWIIYPAGYNANYCRGQCDLSHSRYYHSTLLSKFSNLIGLCCSPKQMAPLRLLYIDEDNKVHQKTVPDMIVESCDCA